MPDILSPATLEKLIAFRKTLHKHPELSGKEQKTAELLKHFLDKLSPDSIYTQLAGHGLAVVFDSGQPGPVVLLRADIDALPIQEVNDFEYRSVNNGVAHKCGHDGHMTILSGVALALASQPPASGKVILIFQPEEETGQGAEKIIKESLFTRHKPDWVFALHNLPGFEQNAVVIRQGPFAAASKGMIITLEGLSSHAAHPEQGNSPVKVMTTLMKDLPGIANLKGIYKDFALITIIHAWLGEIAFGTNPGKAQIMATLRTFYDKDMQLMTSKAEQLVESICKENDIHFKISYRETFPATINNPQAAQYVIQAAQNLDCNIVAIEEPFRWSEDFGHFTANYPGALFGIGAGNKHPGLHNNDYDFPDSIIKPGVEMFIQIIDQILNPNKK